MHARDVCALATRKLRRRWLRTALSVIAVAAALAPLAVVSSLQDGVREGLVRLLLADNLPPGFALLMGKPATRAGEWGPPVLTAEDIDQFRRRAGVEWVHEVSVFPAALLRIDEENASYYLESFPREFIERQARIEVPTGADVPIPVLLERQIWLQHWDEEKGRPEHKEADPRDFIGRDLDLVVGDYVGRPYPYEYTRRKVRRRTEEELEASQRERRAGLATRYDLEKLGTGKVLKARVIGVSPIWGATLVPSEEAKRWTEWRLSRDKVALLPGASPVTVPEVEDVDTVLIKASPSADALALDRAIKTDGFSCTSYELAREEALERLAIVVRMVRYAAGAVMILGLLVVAATLSKIASDSERDIGLYRAVGATRWQVMSVFVAQAGMIGLAGGVVGVVAGNLGARWMSAWAIRSSGAPQVAGYVGLGWRSALEEALPKTFYRFPPLASAGILCAGLCVCVLASLVPSLLAAWRDPIRALRAE